MKPGRSHYRRRPAPHIDMTPLIDCLFTLLIVFMLVATFRSPVIQLTLPRASTQDVAPTPEIMVTVDNTGQYFIDSRRVDPEKLEEELRPLVARTREKVVTFRGDQKMPYQWFVRVLDASRAAGAVHVEVVHQSP
jgi:biopolymer transport protein ExbD